MAAPAVTAADIDAVLSAAFSGTTLRSFDAYNRDLPCPEEGGVLSTITNEHVQLVYDACKACAGSDDGARRDAVRAALLQTVSAPTRAQPGAGRAAPTAPPAAADTVPPAARHASAPPTGSAASNSNSAASSEPRSSTRPAAAGKAGPANGSGIGQLHQPAAVAPPHPPAVGTDCVRVVVRHVGDLTWKELRRGSADALLVAEFEKFVVAKLAAATNRSSGVTRMPLVRQIRSRDTKGPYAFDPLHGLLRIDVVAAVDGASIAVGRPLVLDGGVDRGIVHEKVSASEAALEAGGSGGLELWIRQVVDANELSVAHVPKVLNDLRASGIQELRHLLLVEEEFFKRSTHGPAAVYAAISSERNSLTAGGAAAKASGAAAPSCSREQRAVVERANFHKLKRFIHATTGTLSRVTLLDAAVVRDACKIMGSLYANPTVLALLEKEFLMAYAVHGGAMPRGLLLHGPPGTGKTMLVLLLCEFCGLTMVEPSMMSAGEINRGIVGETEKLLGEMFNRARLLPHLPFIVAIDEIDSAVPKRDENSAGDSHGADKVSVFLSNIQGGSDIPNLALVGASNRRECIDEAVRRRLEIQIYVGYLDNASRKTFIDRKLFEKPLPLAFEKVRNVAKDMFDLAAAAGVNVSEAEFVRSAENRLMKPEADRELLKSVAKQVFSRRKEPRDVVVGAVHTRICTLKEFYECLRGSLHRLTLNFSGAALGKLCARLCASWDGHVRAEESMKPSARPVPLGAHRVADHGPLSKTLQYEILMDHMRQVSMADDIKVGTQLCYEVLTKMQELFHPWLLKRFFDEVLPCATGVMVAHLDRRSDASLQSLLLQVEVYRENTGARAVEEVEFRPWCGHCETYAAKHCSAFGPHAKHVFDLDGTPHAAGRVPQGSCEADDRHVHTGTVEGGVTIEDVLGLLAIVAEHRQLTKLELKNMTAFVAGGATDEKACVEDMLSTNKRACAPGSRTLVAVALDSLAGVTRNESGMGGPSRSIGNRQLFSYVCSSFAEYRCPFNRATNHGLGYADASGNSTGEKICVFVTHSSYVLDEFRELTHWPKSRAEIAAEEELEAKRRPVGCARCGESFSVAEQEEQAEEGQPPSGCQYHAGRPAKRFVNSNGAVALEPITPATEEAARALAAKQAAMLERPEPVLAWNAPEAEVKQAAAKHKQEQLPYRGWCVVWTCCPDKPLDAAGCKRDGHSTEPKPDFALSESVRRMIRTAA